VGVLWGAKGRATKKTKKNNEGHVGKRHVQDSSDEVKNYVEKLEGRQKDWERKTQSYSRKKREEVKNCPRLSARERSLPCCGSHY